MLSLKKFLENEIVVVYAFRLSGAGTATATESVP